MKQFTLGVLMLACLSACQPKKPTAHTEAPVVISATKTLITPQIFYKAR